MAFPALAATSDYVARPKLAFHVEGRAQTAGSKVAVPIIKGGERVATRVVESGDRKAKDVWRQDVRTAAREAIKGNPAWPCDGPCEAIYTFTRRRPKNHYGSRKGVTYLKDTAPAYPTARPDVSKLVRAAEDALTGLAWHDDACAVRQVAAKVWGDTEGLSVTVRQLTPAFDRKETA